MFKFVQSKANSNRSINHLNRSIRFVPTFQLGYLYLYGHISKKKICKWTALDFPFKTPAPYRKTQRTATNGFPLKNPTAPLINAHLICITWMWKVQKTHTLDRCTCVLTNVLRVFCVFTLSSYAKSFLCNTRRKLLPFGKKSPLIIGLPKKRKERVMTHKHCLLSRHCRTRSHLILKHD